MPAHGAMPLASFWSDHDHVLTAIASVVIAIALAGLVNRAVARRGHQLAATPESDTRLRFLRNVTAAGIVLVGIGIALAQFDALDRIAATVLASSAITAAVVGFAARQTLANGVAGLLLAVTQPLRVGDSVSFEGHDGIVEDVRLTSTYLRTAAGSRIVIPNERLAAGILRNDTILGTPVAPEVDVWLPADADASRATQAIAEGVEGARAEIAEVQPWGTRLLVTGAPGDPASRVARGHALRGEAYGALHAAGLR